MKTTILIAKVLATIVPLIMATSNAQAAEESLVRPTLSLRVVDGDHLQCVLSGAPVGTTYDLYFTTNLHSNSTWTRILSGAPGQTLFTVTRPTNGAGFFVVALSRQVVSLQGASPIDLIKDSDGDGVPDWLDAKPNDPRIGKLTITIDTPAAGSVLN